MRKAVNNYNTGITLIALVITIIVLLILAGISISMITGENGILQKTTEAKTQTEIGQEKEIVALAYSSALAKKAGNGDPTPITSEDMNTELTNQGATASGNNPIKVTFDSGRSYSIDIDGTITELGDVIVDDELTVSYQPIIDVDSNLILRSDGVLSCFNPINSITENPQIATPDITNEIPICNNVNKLLHNGFFVKNNNQLCYSNNQGYTIIGNNFDKLYYYDYDSIVWMDTNNNLLFSNINDESKIIASNVKYFIFGRNCLFYQNNNDELFLSIMDTKRNGNRYICESGEVYTYDLVGIKAINISSSSSSFTFDGTSYSNVRAVHMLKENGDFKVLGTNFDKVFEFENVSIMLGEEICPNLFTYGTNIAHMLEMLQSSDNSVYILQGAYCNSVTDQRANKAKIKELWGPYSSDYYLKDINNNIFYYSKSFNVIQDMGPYTIPSTANLASTCGTNFDNMYQIDQLQQDFEEYKLSVLYSQSIDNITENDFVDMGNNIVFTKIDDVWHCYINSNSGDAIA